MGILDRIRRALGDDEASDARAPRVVDDEQTRAIVSRLRDFVVEKSDGVLEARAIDPAEHLYDAGYVDSQSSVALLAFIEEEWGLVISEVDLVGRLSSLDALARHLRSDGQVGEANRA